MKKAINIIFIISIMFLIWLSVSYIEIVCKNINNPVYSNFNLIIRFLEV